MPEMSGAGHVHRDLVFIAEINAQLILDRTSRLNYRLDSSFFRQCHTIGEREEGIGCHDRSVQIKSKRLCFDDRLFQCV